MIKTLTSDDYSQYAELRSLGLTTDPTSFWASEIEEQPIRESRYKEILDNSDDFIMGYFDNSVLMGIGGFRREPSLKLKHKGFLWGIYTHPDYRGKGIGKQLVQALVTKAFEIATLTQVNLSTRTDNHAALRLYEQLGFIKYGEEHNSSCIDGTFYHEVYMVKSRI
ncbi:GNAT family N-acetyltransferase [Roseivirga sp. E12]|uniref:GNAT family N-acetyltransferase n=1 Tax=Roseivirga sp. E12 TaxID=2819237 RepID=UPI001ABCD259|nr:GNAT family N-acetyltransferase [Roseivirga sp. E12]MBO3697811.1 GNAT family N-acetyltransferase [Roseivirga sp. E12]